jgi:hypothetical protein
MNLPYALRRKNARGGYHKLKKGRKSLPYLSQKKSCKKYVSK